MRSILITTLKYGVGLALLALVIGQNWGPSANGDPGLEEILKTGTVQWGPLLIATVIMTGSLLLSFVRWYVLVRAQELPFTLTNAFRLGLIGYFWNTLAPGSVGGDAVKAVLLCREQSRRTVAVATVLIDRAVGLWALFWFVAILGSIFWLTGDEALLSNWKLQVIVQAAIGLVIFTSLVWTGLVMMPERWATQLTERLGRLPRVGGMATELWQAVYLYRSKQWSIAATMGMALVGHVGWVMAFYFSAQSFIIPGQAQIPSITEHYVIVPVGMTFQALVPLPGGIGAGEWGFASLYEAVGKPRRNGVVGSLVQRAITWALALVSYIVYLSMARAAARAKGQAGMTTNGENESEPVPPLEAPPAPVPSISMETP